MEAIKAAILSGRLKPGEMLVERRLAEELGVSKTPVREALIVLTRAGLLEMSRNRGAAVRQLSFTEVRHIYEQRALLEPWAVRSAIGAPQRRFDEAAAALRDADKRGGEGHRAEQALANRRFHRLMYQTCENNFVTRALDGLQDLTALATTGVIWENWPTWEEDSREHWAIYKAAESGDSDLTAQLMREHIEKPIQLLRAREAQQS
ncbi:GntR family transcriptional regulator [Micromonospora viridifaciens]|uniref:GntR family transcriptional regulator n=1 Tax=Micromonospora viridifaciens TaxID=1881 RepID=UPI0018D543ED|nr:GntR family transcriptional regulator [Micromonospora viridifaciens]